MKKNLLFAVIAGVAVMTGCSQNELLESTSSGEQEKMEFTPVVGKQTRASEMNSVGINIKGTTINLYGYRTDGDFSARANFARFFEGAPEALTFNGVWSATRDYAWADLNGGKLSIFSYYSPEGALTGINAPTSTAAANFDYTVPDSIHQQEDLLVATHLDMNKANTGGSIAIKFKHALSQLYFRAKLTENGYIAVIQSIKVLGAKNTGTFTYATTTGAGVGTWTAPTGAYNYIYVDGIAQEITSKDIPALIDTQNGTLMIMPQEAVEGTFQFEVTYDVINAAGTTIGTKIVKTADMAALEMGKKYAYTLILPSSENDIIRFEVEVLDWETNDTSEREVRFDEYQLSGTVITDATALQDLIVGYNPTVIYLQEVKITGAELAGPLAIDLSTLKEAKPGSKIILDCAITNWNTNTITVTVPNGWTVSNSPLSATGKITITKD